MNGRVYDYNLGRFMSVDPFIHGSGNSQGINPYSYIMNNPLAGVDPTGYQCEPAGNSNCGDPVGDSPNTPDESSEPSEATDNGHNSGVENSSGSTTDIGNQSNNAQNGDNQGNNSESGNSTERIKVTCSKECQEAAQKPDHKWAGVGVGGALLLALTDGPQPGPMDVVAFFIIVQVISNYGKDPESELKNMRGTDNQYNEAPEGASADDPGEPSEKDGFKSPKNKKGGSNDGKVKNPNGKGKGWIDSDGNVWVPTGHGPTAHGGPHWDVQNPKTGKHINVYPGGKKR